ncbi:aromatic acid exporter family protein [Sporosarcina sp. BI001-red]|uniref:aromatic acid exporter family protein n=1 Tax=Sporosarcina sp. BI001-red TaxID=2282866 RepID=UPI000E23D4B8|nr:aromatic acid exporter family protein [Sporosarcina sp. BI001-red]REB11629.1 aromatic acid exporter family protein [Sporosarcina sp. BI001-red]
MRNFHFHGIRIVKTGIAIFLTAIICEWFHWPPVFAVITAIVTIEPTVSDSIKKGIVRFPASAIGSAYAVFFIALFGNSPITYTLAAVFTILTCYKLNLHAGLLVATLTAVAMVEVIHSNYLISFFIRLGTTTTGLLVSTAVNMIVFRPDYRKDILVSIQNIGARAGTILEQTFRTILYDEHTNRKIDRVIIHQLNKEIMKTETLIRFQRDESNLPTLLGGDHEGLLMAERQMAYLHNLDYHLGNLDYLPSNQISWSNSERDIIMHAVAELANDLQHPAAYNSEKHQLHLKNLTDLFWRNNEEITNNNEIHPTQFPPELVMLYELITIYNLVDRFYNPERTSSHEKSNTNSKTD